MKTLIFFSILFCVIALPALAELTPQDLDKIRLIVNEEVTKELTPIKADIVQLDTRLGNVEAAVSSLTGRIDGLDTRLRNVEVAVGSLTGRIDGVEKQVLHSTNVTYWLIALIVGAIAIPQLIMTFMTWRSAGDREQKRINQELREEIETLKRQQIVRP